MGFNLEEVVCPISIDELYIFCYPHLPDVGIGYCFMSYFSGIHTTYNLSQFSWDNLPMDAKSYKSGIIRSSIKYMT
jgi:hypothetical protein